MPLGAQVHVARSDVVALSNYVSHASVTLITKRRYGFDLCDGRGLFLEDRGIAVPEQAIRRSARAGINPKLRGHDAPLRFRVDPRQLA